MNEYKLNIEQHGNCFVKIGGQYGIQFRAQLNMWQRFWVRLIGMEVKLDEKE